MRLASVSPGAVVLDTNVVSELMREVPDEEVRNWVDATPPPDIYTTAVTLAEVRFGIRRLPSGRRRDVLARAADDVFGAFAERVLPFDAEAAHVYAEIVVDRERLGRPILGFDAQIAAICSCRRLTLVTRNTDDFTQLGLRLVNPWLRGA